VNRADLAEGVDRYGAHVSAALSLAR
jgi:hypothetical protein